jgi:hypothetical protein
MAKEAKAVVKQEAQVPAPAPQGPVEGSGISSDLIIPRLLLMQGLSAAVAERKAQQGDMIRSTTNEVIGGPDKPLDIVPLKLTPAWRVEEKIGGKFEFRRMEERTAANDSLPWEFQENGSDWRRVKVLNLFALLERDIKAFLAAMQAEDPDLGAGLLPVLISFRSTSFPAGKVVATYYAQVRDFQRYNPNAKSYAHKLQLSCKQDKNDKGSYYVFQVEGKPKRLDPTLIPEAERWFNQVNAMKEIKVDVADDEGGADLDEKSNF